jgi:hypothetical protein
MHASIKSFLLNDSWTFTQRRDGNHCVPFSKAFSFYKLSACQFLSLYGMGCREIYSHSRWRTCWHCGIHHLDTQVACPKDSSSVCRQRCYTREAAVAKWITHDTTDSAWWIWQSNEMSSGNGKLQYIGMSGEMGHGLKKVSCMLCATEMWKPVLPSVYVWNLYIVAIVKLVESVE